MQNIESDCQRRAQRACTLDQPLAGPVAADGSRIDRYTYSRALSAWPGKRTGLAGYSFLSKSFPRTDATYNRSGTALVIDQDLTSRSIEGDSFATR